MRSFLSGILNAYCKTGLIFLGVAALVFLRGLIKDPSPSDEFRWLIVIGFGVIGTILCAIGLIAARRPHGA